MPDIYTVDHNDRMAVNRLRAAARRGDERAKATLEWVEQQKHTDRWDAAEQHRADLAAERANRHRPGSIASTMDALRKARDEKAERTRKALGPADETTPR